MKRLLLFSTIALIAFLGSCKDEQASSITKFSVKITDAPGAYQSLFLNVKEIQVITSESTSVLPVDNEPFDILRFRMGADTLLASEYIPSGKLQEVRLVLNEDGNTVVIDDVPYNLTIPSGQSSGVKLKVQADLTSGIAYTLLLDFDAAKSVVKTGNDKYILKPVIRAIPEAVSGAMRGAISPASSNPKIYAITGVDTIGTLTDSLGNFYFPGLKEGTYKVNVEPIETYEATTLDNVSVTNGSVTDLGTINLTER